LIDFGIKPHSYISRAWDNGETLYEIVFDAASEQRFGGPYLNVHRGDLHGVLERVVAPETITFNHRLVDLDDKGDAIHLTFQNGLRAAAEIVIGADGLRSKVREYLFGNEPRALSAPWRMERFLRRNDCADSRSRTVRNGGAAIDISCPTS
jgi:6-hydroxynicotinate 3-monooxygenase